VNRSNLRISFSLLHNIFENESICNWFSTLFHRIRCIHIVTETYPRNHINPTFDSNFEEYFHSDFESDSGYWTNSLQPEYPCLRINPGLNWIMVFPVPDSKGSGIEVCR